MTLITLTMAMLNLIWHDKMKRITLSTALFIASICGISAHDFMITQNGQKIYFNITDSKRQTVEVTYGGSITDKNAVKPQGKVEIPAKVQHNQKVYNVTAVGKKAFANATELTSIVLPGGITEIKDFAFERCSKLSSVIMPGTQVKFGQGTFFLCSEIEHVTFGSDWTQIDLAVFRWADKMKEITIPAKVTKIYNINSLKGLKAVTVDNNNSQYSSIDGIVYTKDAKVLLACPLAYEGALKVADNATIIKAGAMLGCTGITSIDLPETLEKFSFREFCKMTRLQTINLRNTKPVTTAKDKNGAVFVLQTANPKVRVNVPTASLKDYKKALVATEGEYFENSPKATIPYFVKSTEMVTTQNLLGVKSFK